MNKDDILVNIDKKNKIVLINYNGTKLIKTINEYKDMTEEEIKEQFIKIFAKRR